MCGLLLHVEEVWALWFLCTANQTWEKEIQPPPWSHVSLFKGIKPRADAGLAVTVCLLLFQRLHGQIAGWDGERSVQQGGVASTHHLQQQRQPLGEGGWQQSERWEPVIDSFQCPGNSFWVYLCWSVRSSASTFPGVVSHSADSAPAKPANPVKPDSVQSNGPSHPAEEAPPTPVEDKNSNGCSQPAAASHDQNGSMEPTTDTKETETAHERPAKKCRLEAEPLDQSEAEPSRTQENWEIPRSSMLTGGTHPDSLSCGRGQGDEQHEQRLAPK